MPIPWMVILKSVPWTDVIRNAPTVADSAKKLWNTVSKYASAQDSQTESSSAIDTNAKASLQSRLVTMEDAVERLHEQMLASSDLIKMLAEQNSQLIARIEVTRRRVKALTIAVTAVAIINVAGLIAVLAN